jgi:uncharacterized lipoprotein YehR (DUF1307 family)
MKTTRKQLLLALALPFFLLTACGPESEFDAETQNQLLGRWNLKEAYRNGSQAESLENLFFEFTESGEMRTNILGATTQTDYLFEGDKIVQTAGDNGMEVAYSVESISDTSLVLTTTLRRYNFKFDLRRGVAQME